MTVEFLRRAGTGVVRFVRDAPLLVAFTVVCVFCLPGGEFFPLSSFPMYSRNKAKSYMVYLRDGEGNPIGSQRSLGVRTGHLKKDYERELNRLVDQFGISDYEMSAEQRRPAAENVLRYLVTRRAPERAAGLGTDAIELVDVRIERKEGRIKLREEVVGRVPVGP